MKLDKELMADYKRIKHQARPPIFESERARQIYMQAELEESRQDCNNDMDYLRCRILNEQLLDRDYDDDKIYTPTKRVWEG